MIEIYRAGICNCSVCVPEETTREQIEKEVNLRVPTGLDHGWKISEDKTFVTGHPNPCVCDRDPDRLHYLLSC